MVHSRHNHLRDVLGVSLRSWGLHVTWEVLVNKVGSERMDLVVSGTQGEDSLPLTHWIDVSVLNTGNSSNIGTAEPRKGAREREAAKSAKYENMCRMAGAVLVPAVIESTSALGPKFCSFLDHAAAATHTHTERNAATFAVFQRLAVSQAVTVAIAHINRHTPFFISA